VWSEIDIPHSQAGILSSEQPVYRMNFTDTSLRIEIELVRIETNATQVTVDVGRDFERVLHVTNVTHISNVSIGVDTNTQGNWWIEVSRQDKDVTYSLEVLEWLLVPPPAIDVMLSPLPGFGVMLSIFSAYQLLKIQFSCGELLQWRLKEKGGRRKSPMAVFIFVLVGTLLIIPISRGYFNGDFNPVPEVNASIDQSFLLELNETSPSSSVNLTSQYAMLNRIVDISVHSINSEEIPFVLSIRDSENITLLRLHQSSSNATWFLKIPLDGIDSYFLQADRLNESCDVTFRLRVRTRTYSYIYDPTFYSIIALGGAFLCIYAIMTAHRIDQYLSEKNQN
jgi:hypothetical protein